MGQGHSCPSLSIERCKSLPGPGGGRGRSWRGPEPAASEQSRKAGAQPPPGFLVAGVPEGVSRGTLAPKLLRRVPPGDSQARPQRADQGRQARRLAGGAPLTQAYADGRRACPTAPILRQPAQREHEALTPARGWCWPRGGQSSWTAVSAADPSAFTHIQDALLLTLPTPHIWVLSGPTGCPTICL